MLRTDGPARTASSDDRRAPDAGRPARGARATGLVAVAALGLAALPAGAAAADPGFTTTDLTGGVRTLVAARPAQRVCTRTALASGTDGVVQQRLTAPKAGLVTARLGGDPRGADWDLAVFDATTRRLIDGSAAFGGNEVVSVPAAAGQTLLVQACRVSGAAAAVPLSAEEAIPTASLAPADDLSLVTIAVSSQEDVDRLRDAGIDLNETGGADGIAAVLHGPEDAATIRRLGLTFRTTIPDLAAADRRAARRDRAVAGRSALPSGRTGYRSLVDYENDLKALVAAHPGVVRPVVLPHLSVQGRTVQGVEIATDVARTDDGRPTIYQLGLHHVREWPSGELPMEYAQDLLTADDAADAARKKRLLDGERTFVLPVMNPDGLVATQLAGTTTGAADDDQNATLALSAAGAGAYRRKNCGDGLATPAPSTATAPCSTQPGVDLNRNYGAFWGGPGSSDQLSSQTYRGASPFSEPETQNFHDWSSGHVVNVVNSNHTFGGDLLYQPGFNAADEPGLPKGTKVPFQDEMKALSDAAATAAGYKSFVSYNLYDVTGATEDWNYFATGAFGYTTEIAFENFHPNYQDGVVDQYLGTVDGAGAKAAGRKPSQGLREAMLLQGEAALDPAQHATISGTAPAGRVLRLRKTFTTSTSFVETTGSSAPGPASELPEQLDFSRTVPANGSYTWAVGPSTRPVALLAGRKEAYTLTCEDTAGKVYATRQVTVDLGATSRQDFAGACGPVATTPPTTTPAPGGGTTTTPAGGATTTPAGGSAGANGGTTGAGGASGTDGSAATVRLTLARPAFSLRRYRRGRPVRVRVRLTGGASARRVVVRITNARGRTILRARLATLRGSRTVRLKRVAPLRAIRTGRVRVRVTGVVAGKAVRATKTTRITR